jgi:hypothetical protein
MFIVQSLVKLRNNIEKNVGNEVEEGEVCITVNVEKEAWGIIGDIFEDMLV